MVIWTRMALWTSNSLEQAYILKNPDFVEWCAEQMKDRSSQIITVSNFKWLWESPEWNADPSVREALTQFAEEPAYTDKLVNLWPLHEVPASLIRILPVQ